MVKELKLTLGETPVEDAPGLMLVGSKARDGLARSHGKYIGVSYDEVYGGPVTFSLASFLAEQMLSKPVDEYTLLYNQFKSVIAFEVAPMKIKGPSVLGESGVLDECALPPKHVLPPHRHAVASAAPRRRPQSVPASLSRRAISRLRALCPCTAGSPPPPGCGDLTIPVPWGP